MWFVLPSATARESTLVRSKSIIAKWRLAKQWAAFARTFDRFVPFRLESLEARAAFEGGVIKSGRYPSHRGRRLTSTKQAAAFDVIIFKATAPCSAWAAAAAASGTSWGGGGGGIDTLQGIVNVDDYWNRKCVKITAKLAGIQQAPHG
jgi:hypothetical protein